jgi:hypothetical protein
MKKIWNKPNFTTLIALELSGYIKAAAWSEEGICTDFVLR